MTKHQIQPRNPIQVSKTESGDNIVEVNLAALSQPKDVYHADWYCSEARAGGARFIFGKLGVTRQRLASVLEISLSKGALKIVAGTLTVNDFMSKLSSYVKNSALGWARPELGDLVNLTTSELTKEHSFVASFVFVGFNEDDATMSFFRLPPGADRLGDITQVSVTPLVRIDSTASVLHAFCEDVIKFSGDGG